MGHVIQVLGDPMDFLMFSKKLGSLSMVQLGETVSELGMDGVDLTVRPGGHIEPKDVSTELPKAIEVLQSFDLSVPMITTGITDPDDPASENILSTAADCGVSYAKLGYWKYEGFGSLERQIQEMRMDLSGIERMAKDLGITAAVHIHSGDYLTATGCLAHRILEGFDPVALGAYIDPGHMVVEGGKSGWELGMDLLAPLTRMVAVKDFVWVKEVGRDKSWKVKHAPLREGMVPWPEVFENLADISFDGPVSFHSEYGDLSVDEIIAQTVDDLAYIREITG